MKRNLFIAISLSIMILLLLLISGNSTPRDLDERAREALKYSRENGSIACWWTMADIQVE